MASQEVEEVKEIVLQISNSPVPGNLTVLNNYLHFSLYFSELSSFSHFER